MSRAHVLLFAFFFCLPACGSAPVVGILDLEVREGLRRQGLAKFVLVHLLRHVQEQFFSLVEVQANERNEAALRLYRGLGFEQVDTGRTYRKVGA